MSFEIIIKETRTLEVWKGHEWLSKADGTPGYDYTPQIKSMQTQTREVLSQVVDELDLKAVLRAINGI